MIKLYIFSLVLGGGLLLAATFGGEHDHDVSSHPDHALSGFDILSLRTLTYFLFTFGGVGVALSLVSTSLGGGLVLLVSALVGIGVGGLSGAVFRYLRRSSAGERAGDSSFVGLVGTVTIPLTNRGIGKVSVRRGSRQFDLAARPFEEGSLPAEQWRDVVVVEMRGGTALVAPVDRSLAPGP